MPGCRECRAGYRVQRLRRHAWVSLLIRVPATKVIGRWNLAGGGCFLKSSEGIAMSDIPYPDTPQPDIPVPPQPDLPTPVPETEPGPDEEPDLPPSEPSDLPGDDVPKVG